MYEPLEPRFSSPLVKLSAFELIAPLRRVPVVDDFV
jgi:hypothetical protein